jgi:hypothetical protein
VCCSAIIVVSCGCFRDVSCVAIWDVGCVVCCNLVFVFCNALNTGLCVYMSVFVTLHTDGTKAPNVRSVQCNRMLKYNISNVNICTERSVSMFDTRGCAPISVQV